MFLAHIEIDRHADIPPEHIYQLLVLHLGEMFDREDFTIYAHSYDDVKQLFRFDLPSSGNIISHIQYTGGCWGDAVCGVLTFNRTIDGSSPQLWHLLQKSFIRRPIPVCWVSSDQQLNFKICCAWISIQQVKGQLHLLFQRLADFCEVHLPLRRLTLGKESGHKGPVKIEAVPLWTPWNRNKSRIHVRWFMRHHTNISRQEFL